MTWGERSALLALERKVDRERRSAECPCAMQLAAVLAEGLRAILMAAEAESGAGSQTPGSER